MPAPGTIAVVTRVHGPSTVGPRHTWNPRLSTSDPVAHSSVTDPSPGTAANDTRRTAVVPPTSSAPTSHAAPAGRFCASMSNGVALADSSAPLSMPKLPTLRWKSRRVVSLKAIWPKLIPSQPPPAGLWGVPLVSLARLLRLAGSMSGPAGPPRSGKT